MVFLLLLSCNPNPKMVDLESAHQIQASVLYQAFVVDEIKASSNFNNKVLEVVGSLKKVTIDDNKKLILILDSKHDSGNVLCKMEQSAGSLLSKLELGEAIKVKGYCIDFRLDLILNRCVLM